MNKAELVELVATRLECNRAEADRAVEAVIACIADGLRSESKVMISGFGTFRKKQRSPRVGINPSTRERLHIGATTTCGFRPSPTLREVI